MQKKLPKNLVLEYKTVYYSRDGKVPQNSFVIKETSYQIFINGKKFTSVMLLPEKEKEFAYGFLFTSSFIDRSEDIINFRICDNNNIHIYLSDMHFDITEKINWTLTSGCGGGKVVDNIYIENEKVTSQTKWPFEEIVSLFAKLEEESLLHSYTRCVHKAYYKSTDGFLFTCEDIGRHNTIDKCIGAVLLHKSTFEGVMLSTGRLTSEMILKCARAKIPVVVSRTAPSEEGIRIAKNANITLIGLASKKGFTVFTGEERIK
jgi:FdhD protein